MVTPRPLDIVLLPGLDGTLSLRDELADRLSEKRRVHLVAYPVDQRLGYRELGMFVRDRLPEGRFALLGESFSGPIAIEIAAAKPDRVAGLVLSSTFSRHPLPSFLAYVAAGISPKYFPRALIEVFMLGRAATPPLRAALAMAIAEVSPDILQHRIVEALRVDYSDMLGRIRCPALCLVGRRERLISARHSRDIAKALQRCQIKTLDAPHMLLQSNAEEAASVIDEFCNGVD